MDEKLQTERRVFAVSGEQQAWLLRAQMSFRGAKLLDARGLFGDAADLAFFTMFYVAKSFLAGLGLRFTRQCSTISAFGQHCVKTALAPAHFQRCLLDAQAIARQNEFGFTALSPEISSRLLQHATEFLQYGERAFATTMPMAIPTTPTTAPTA